MNSKWPVRILTIGLLLFSSLACTLCAPRPAQPRPAQAGPKQARQEEKDPGLTVLAGSELKELEPLLPEIQQATGVKMTFQYAGTLEGAELIAAGQPTGSDASKPDSRPIDFAWFSQAKYLSQLKGASGRIHAQEAIMLSPVVLGVKLSKARAWGWENNPDLTWLDVVRKAGSGELRYAMTDPAASNTGFSALVGAASALAGRTDALQAGDIRAVSSELEMFFKGQALTGRSSGWLADQYVQEQDQLDGMVNYEAVLLSLNKSGQLSEPLTLVYPREGILTADYPLLLINPGQRAAYQKVVDYLRSPVFQYTLMTRTLHRPVNPQVALSSDFPTRLQVELPFPGSLELVKQLLSARPD